MRGGQRSYPRSLVSFGLLEAVHGTGRARVIYIPPPPSFTACQPWGSNAENLEPPRRLSRRKGQTQMFFIAMAAFGTGMAAGAWLIGESLTAIAAGWDLRALSAALALACC